MKPGLSHARGDRQKGVGYAYYWLDRNPHIREGLPVDSGRLKHGLSNISITLPQRIGEVFPIFGGFWGTF